MSKLKVDNFYQFLCKVFYIKVKFVKKYIDYLMKFDTMEMCQGFIEIGLNNCV